MGRYGNSVVGVPVMDEVVVVAPYLLFKSIVAYPPLAKFVKTPADVNVVKKFIILSACIPMGEFRARKPTVSSKELNGE